MLIQDELVNKLSCYLPQHAIIYLSSDSNRVILWMIKKFLQNKSFKLIKHSEVLNNIENHFSNNILTNLLIEDRRNNNNTSTSITTTNTNCNDAHQEKEINNTIVIQQIENLQENNNRNNSSDNNNDDTKELNEEEENINENGNDNDNEEEEKNTLEETELIKLYNDFWISYNPLVSIQSLTFII